MKNQVAQDNFFQELRCHGDGNAVKFKVGFFIFFFLLLICFCRSSKFVLYSDDLDMVLK